MRTIRTKVYKFDELSKPIQEKVIQDNYNINTDYDQWADDIIEDNVEKLVNLGFNDAKIYYSGFSSQGDGACFTCSYIDFDKFMDGKYKAYSDELSCIITHNYRYYFATSTNVELSTESNNINDELYADIEWDIKNEREIVGNDIYRQLEHHYNLLSSDVEIQDALISNEYEFTKEGKRI